MSDSSTESTPGNDGEVLPPTPLQQPTSAEAPAATLAPISPVGETATETAADSRRESAAPALAQASHAAAAEPEKTESIRLDSLTADPGKVETADTEVHTAEEAGTEQASADPDVLD